jgi:hypothetical protein
MKELNYLKIFAALVFISSIAKADISSPRDLKDASNSIPTIGFINYYLSDFRLLFCGESILADRVKRSVCVVDVAGSSKEIEITAGDTIETVTKKLNLKMNAAFQLRLIQQFEISQSAVAVSGADGKIVSDVNQRMLERPVFPGDIIVNTTIFEWDRGTSGLDRIKKETNR